MVYYNPFFKRIIFDRVDYVLISIMLSIYVTEYFKKQYFPERLEKQKMERLRQDLIKKSKVSQLSSKRLPSSSLVRSVKKIFSIRGGNEEQLYTNVEKIKTFVMYLFLIVEHRIDKKKIWNFLFLNFRSYLYLILQIWQIDLFCILDPITGQSVIMTIAFGGTSGFIISWFGVGATLVGNSLGLVLLSKSFTQQLISTLEHRKFQNQVTKFLNNKELHSLVVPADKKLKLETLNWNKKPALKETAERLGVFEETPNLGGPIKSTENSLYNRCLKKLEKAVEKVVDKDSGIIDVKFVHENPSLDKPRIKIRD